MSTQSEVFDSPAVAVIIPAWNAATTIADQLAALATQKYAGSWRVVVVDDGSTDETAAIVEANVASFPVPLCIVRQPNRGAGAARNCGVLSTDEPWLLFCDADDEVAAGWVSSLAAALKYADGAGGRLELDRLNSTNMLRWAAPTRMWEKSWLTESEWGMPSPISACCAVSREAWSAVGGFNEHLITGEDADFFWRLQLQGHLLTDVPDAIVSYRLAATPRPLLRKLYRSGRACTLLLWAFGHPKRRRQLLIETAAALLRSPRVITRESRRRAIYDLVWCAGRIRGLPLRASSLPTGPSVRPLAGK